MHRRLGGMHRRLGASQSARSQPWPTAKSGADGFTEIERAVVTDPQNPTHPKQADDPSSIPLLTDILVPGRPSTERRAETASAAPVASSASTATEAEGHHEAAPLPGPAATVPAPSMRESVATRESTAAQEDHGLDERDIDVIAERLRARFSNYLRDEGRGMIEARCRDALQEHTNWLLRQVTREIALALESEVTGWVRDAVRAELAAHRSRR